MQVQGNSLNRDLQVSHDYHCAVTAHLDDEDVGKFSKKTPNIISRGIKRIWDIAPPQGIPSSKRIVEDVERALEAMRRVEEEGGKIVPKLLGPDTDIGRKVKKEGMAEEE